MEERELLEYIQRFLRLGEVFQSTRNFQSIASELAALDAEIEERDERVGFHDMSQLILGSEDLVIQKFVQALVHRECSLTAIALKRYRLAQGEYPEDLADLVPDYLDRLPIDFMDGQPLRYRRLPADEFLLYSVNRDGVDDGGDPNPSEEDAALINSPGRDFVWPRAAQSTEMK